MTISDVTLTSMQYLSYWMLKNAKTIFSFVYLCLYKVSKDLKVLLLLLHVRGWDFVDFFPSTIVQYVAIYYRIMLSGIKE